MAEHTDNNEYRRDRRPSMERHLQTFLIAVAVGLVAWFGNKVTTLGETTIQTKTSVENTAQQVRDLKADITGVRDQLREFYLRSEAERVHGEITAWLRRNDQRLLDLEREIKP